MAPRREPSQEDARRTLEAARDRLQRARREAIDAQGQVDEAIRVAVAAGLRQKDVAELMGLTKQRVHQIVHGRPERS